MVYKGVHKWFMKGGGLLKGEYKRKRVFRELMEYFLTCIIQSINNCVLNNHFISYCSSFCIYKGIFAAAQLVLPKDCSGNAFCEITKMIIGPTARFYITGQFEWKKIRVAVGFAHIRIWDGLYFDKLELYVEVGQRWTSTERTQQFSEIYTTGTMPLTKLKFFTIFFIFLLLIIWIQRRSNFLKHLTMKKLR